MWVFIGRNAFNLGMTKCFGEDIENDKVVNMIFNDVATQLEYSSHKRREEVLDIVFAGIRTGQQYVDIGAGLTKFERY